MARYLEFYLNHACMNWKVTNKIQETMSARKMAKYEILMVWPLRNLSCTFQVSK
jgi:hypothetical protein